MNLDEALDVLADSRDWNENEEEMAIVIDFIMDEIMRADGDNLQTETEEDLDIIYDRVNQRAKILVADRLLEQLQKKGLIEPLIDETGEVFFRLTPEGAMAKEEMIKDGTWPLDDD
jgi:hypothetical protein